MDRKPEKRRLTWFGNNRPVAPKGPATPIPPNPPGTLGKLWEREPRGREEPGAWPQLPQGDLFAPRGANDVRRDERYDDPRGDSYTDEHAAPAWGQSDVRQESSRGGRLRTLWRTFATSVRRPWLAVVAVVATLTLCAVIGGAAIGAAFFNNPATGARHPAGAGSVSGATTSAQATATATATGTVGATPASTTAPVALTITFTCASGAAGGAGQVCVRTTPHAALNLTVRYCDGSNAKGKTFHTTSYADSGGNYTWRWNVPSGACVGAATATVTAQLAGKTISQRDTFAITR